MVHISLRANGGRSVSRGGFTLLELTVSMAILTVVGLLTFVVTATSTSAAGVAEAKELAQASVRNAMTVMAAELSLASKKTNNALVPPLQALTVVSPTEIRFQVPADINGITWSAPITYRFVNEDKNGNGRLDHGEDTDGDKGLTRHIVRIQGDTQRVIGAANDLSAVQFTLDASSGVLNIQLDGSRAIDNRRHDLVTARATSRIYLVN